MIKIPDSVVIHPTAQINVESGSIGERTIIEAHASLEGRHIEIGAESWIGQYASIGGGSCHDSEAYLKAGDWLHLGPYAHINTARGVDIGHEVGIGWKSNIFTHGAYLPVTMGFPVQWGGVKIGNRVWLPNAWVNPGVTIGDNIVVAAMSLVNIDLPDGCLAGGVPVKIIQELKYPTPIFGEERDRLLQNIVNGLLKYLNKFTQVYVKAGVISVYYNYYHGFSSTTFDTINSIIYGKATPFSQLLKDQLRRNGIRFRYTEKDGEYVEWNRI